MTAIANQLGLNYLRDRWRGVNSLENQDLVKRHKDASEPSDGPRALRRAAIDREKLNDGLEQ
jgi:hypothetical protein